MPIDAAGQPGGEPFVVVPLTDGRIYGLSIGGDGTLAFGLQTSDINLWAVDVTGDGAPLSEPVRLTDDVVRNSHPDYSSTGRIAYVQLPGNTFSTWRARRRPECVRGLASDEGYPRADAFHVV